MAEKSNALTFKEIVLQVDHLLFLVERLAIFLERMFLLERLAVIVFVLYPRSATPFADFFCYSCILDLIRSALRLNPNETKQGDGYLFRIERAMAILLKLHCTNRIIFIARVVFVVTNSVYFVDTLETKQKSAQKQPQQQHSGRNKPKQGQQMQGIISSVSTTHTYKFRLKEKAESAAGASKGENNRWEGDSMQEDEDQLKEKPDTEEENTKREDDLLEVDDSWEDLNSLEEVDDSWEEELVEADEIDSVSEIKNLMKKGEVERLKFEEREVSVEAETGKREKHMNKSTRIC
ncbi:hypothetical protein L3X38_044273 [Prunus dulcis]|uniref:Uncharacterized protein n=1 Tax=Prunus dulcis TaxID=3755 RepID=A0AAD4YM16_PRUDU|nr:hypothetical protein L3X38_044273 [Prunus dulcis]